MDPAISFVQALSNKPHVVTMTSGAGLEAAVRGCRSHLPFGGIFLQLGLYVGYDAVPAADEQA